MVIAVIRDEKDPWDALLSSWDDGTLSSFHAKRLKSLIGPRVVDILLHLPTRWQSRHVLHSLPTQTVHLRGQSIAVIVTPSQFLPSPRRGGPLRVVSHDTHGQRLDLVFYHTAAHHRARRDLPIGQPRVVSGVLDHYNGMDQIVHPESIRPVPATFRAGQTLEAVYPLTAGLTQAIVRFAVAHALKRLPNHDMEWLRSRPAHWPRWAEALRCLHRPTVHHTADDRNQARARLAFDELLVHHLGLQLAGIQRLQQRGIPLVPDHHSQENLEKHLPFRLTQGQRLVIDEIRQAMQPPHKTVHLLQGDVGSGKTLVAWMIIQDALASGTQAALLVPTDILATQHAEKLKEWAQIVGVRCELLKSKMPAAHKRTVRQALADGTLDVVIGTHALLEDDVIFHRLGLVVIDEQHRFGVEQRMRLVQKSAEANVLLMTATPIPRTLVLSSYGDLSCSRLLEKPPGRTMIDTRVLPIQRLSAILEALPRILEKHERIYWICPMIDEHEDLESGQKPLMSAEERAKILEPSFPGLVGCVHGRIKNDERQRLMDNFRTGQTPILVATTVIEVGVDVPEATLIVIEHAERFGLAQLHQLRGRVGRSDRSSRCLLLYHPPLSSTAQARLEALRTTDDGFKIAEMDLTLRGAGEILGQRQSGDVDFRLASPDFIAEHAETAFAMAKEWVLEDPTLQTERGQRPRILLQLFNKEHFALSGIERV